ncbi:hypothetical protein PGT21_025452 [Puccinia graminis f. sp. tritici]|uniref:Uncharacterized protein n=1 Tax=Puccinia graminis f. sp. tritici TaxID=56615 RepID=A0A5B0P6Q0_PUCGR|nr:hypothetical protein PGT21_025452 [Puccinia graminis f. sp. tritici]
MFSHSSPRIYFRSSVPFLLNPIGLDYLGALTSLKSDRSAFNHPNTVSLYNRSKRHGRKLSPQLAPQLCILIALPPSASIRLVVVAYAPGPAIMLPSNHTP